MLAYSSISHIAFVLVAIILSVAMNDQGVFIFYLMTYSIASLLVFVILDYLEQGNSIFLDQLNGLSKHQPILALALAIGILSMAGIPFTGGFIAKYRVLMGIYQLNVWIFAIGLLSSAIAIGYYLKILNRIFFHENSQENVAIKNNLFVGVVSILALVTITLGIFPELILQVIHSFFVA
jgi:NADH-quinone oxidoreductase subunit N